MKISAIKVIDITHTYAFYSNKHFNPDGAFPMNKKCFEPTL